MNQPGFGFYVGDGNGPSWTRPTNPSQIFGYDAAVLAQYICGAWLIYWGLRPKKSILH
jgi:hypothetical protein